MKRRFRLPTALLFGVVVAACQPKHRPIEGGVFIVKQNSENVKLGLVDVGFYDSQAVTPVIVQADQKAREELEGLQKKISDQEATISALEQEQKKGQETVQQLVAEHDSIRTGLEAVQARLAAALDVKLGANPEMQKAIADLETIRQKIDRWNREAPAQIASLRARQAYLKKLDFAERSKLRPYHEKPREFPEIGELERQINLINQESKEQIASLTQDQQVAMAALNRAEEKAKVSQKSASLALAELEREADTLREKASEVEKRIKNGRASLLTRNAEIATLGKELSALRSRLMNFNQEFEGILFSSLPATSLQSKTDADGNFRILLPYRGSFCVVARATRRITDDLEEHYSWFFRVPPREEDQDRLFGLFYTPFAKPAADRLLLSNDNQIQSGFPDSLVSYPLKP